MTAALPSYVKVLRDGFAEQRESALLRTELESGPPRQAKVKSRVMVTRPVKLMLSSRADFASFKTWYASTINEGADWFTWYDPVTASTLTVRFVSGGFDATPLGSVDGAWVISAQIENWSA